MSCQTTHLWQIPIVVFVFAHVVILQAGGQAPRCRRRLPLLLQGQGLLVLVDVDALAQLRVLLQILQVAGGG